MNAEKIKDVLISYLTATHAEIRIYKEKSIGPSICDIMAVTDRLTGFEIKSDLDNYRRLPEQIKAYNEFFDENYLVVGYGHINSATEKVPSHWGIILICDTDVKVLREAGHNPLVSRRKQLSILWKLELKNILTKNNLPAFAQKGNAKRIINRLKKFDKLCEEIHEDLKQTARRKSELEFLLANEESSYKKKLADCEAEAKSIKACMEELHLE